MDHVIAYQVTRALQNETMILEVLEAQEPAVFRQQLFSTLTTYYEEIQSMSGAGRPKPKHFKRTMIADEEAAGGGEPIEEAAAAADDKAPPPPPPPAADDAAPDTAAPPHPPQERGKRAWQFRCGKGTIVNKSA
jgi:hypothetical protein